jgi:SNF2 family DNA or RNA helicase
MGKKGIPNAPHAIIIPNSLVDQWRRELKVFFKAFSIEIFVLPSSTNDLKEYFESDFSPWKRGKHDDIQRIVLVPHSVRHSHLDAQIN